MSKKDDINKAYKNLKASIPAITKHFHYLKNRTKSLYEIPIIHNNSYFNSSYFNPLSRNMLTSLNISNYDYNYNYSFLSPKPVLKPYYNNNNIKLKNNILNYKLNSYRFGNENIKNNSQNKPFFKYDFESNYPIPKFNIYNKRNYSDNPIKKNKNTNNIKNNEFNFEDNNNLSTTRDLDKEKYEYKFKKLNEKINEKDKLIYKMKGIIDDTFNKLDNKKKENSILKNEILELKEKSKSERNHNLTRANNNNIYNKVKNNNIRNIKERVKKNKVDRKKYNANENKINNYYKIYYNNDNYNNKNYEEKMEQKLDDIRKLNIKMDNLLYRKKNK